MCHAWPSSIASATWRSGRPASSSPRRRASRSRPSRPAATRSRNSRHGRPSGRPSASLTAASGSASRRVTARSTHRTSCRCASEDRAGAARRSGPVPPSQATIAGSPPPAPGARPVGPPPPPGTQGPTAVAATAHGRPAAGPGAAGGRSTAATPPAARAWSTGGRPAGRARSPGSRILLVLVGIGLLVELLRPGTSVLPPRHPGRRYRPRLAWLGRACRGATVPSLVLTGWGLAGSARSWASSRATAGRRSSSASAFLAGWAPAGSSTPGVTGRSGSAPSSGSSAWPMPRTLCRARFDLAVLMPLAVSPRRLCAYLVWRRAAPADRLTRLGQRLSPCSGPPGRAPRA